MFRYAGSGGERHTAYRWKRASTERLKAGRHGSQTYAPNGFRAFVAKNEGLQILRHLSEKIRRDMRRKKRRGKLKAVTVQRFENF